MELMAVISAFVALASLILNVVVARGSSIKSKSDAFFRLCQLVNSERMRDNRSKVYGLDRAKYSDWSESERSAVDAWCACLDLALTLYKERGIDRNAYLYMFGDVTLRTVYQIVPYCNSKILARGEQFLIPMRITLPILLKQWRRAAKRGKYPLQLTISWERNDKITPDSFEGDDLLYEFSNKRRKRG